MPLLGVLAEDARAHARGEAAQSPPRARHGGAAQNRSRTRANKLLKGGPKSRSRRTMHAFTP
eukprot:1131121-Prorocentrum_minimum.AAC.1